MTEEHLVADWAHRAFARARKPISMLRGTFVGPGQMTLTADEPVITAKVICRSCNNEWLSGIDDAAARVLKPLIRGEHAVVLDRVGQAAVAAWIYKCALIFDATEHGPNGELASLRAGFMASRLAGPGSVIFAGPAASPPSVSVVAPATTVNLWMLGIRPATGKMHLTINVADADGGLISSGTPTELPIPGYQIMVGALWAYLGGQISPVAPEALRGFEQVWPSREDPVTLQAASLITGDAQLGER